jgi:hypothetical protein
LSSFVDSFELPHYVKDINGRDGSDVCVDDTLLMKLEQCSCGVIEWFPSQHKIEHDVGIKQDAHQEYFSVG